MITKGLNLYVMNVCVNVCTFSMMMEAMAVGVMWHYVPLGRQIFKHFYFHILLN